MNVALIGCGGRGTFVARGLAEAGANVLYLCDLNEERLNRAAGFLEDVQPQKPKLVQDMRRIFDDPEVDAVAIATPDHWHALPTIMACAAGKDVYVEKPHSHAIEEGARMVEAGRKHSRIIQVGTQNRSGAYNLAAREYIRSGKLGPIHLVKVYNLKPGDAFHLGEPGEPPPNFDWNQWLGPAPVRPWHRRIFHGGWMQFWDYSDSDMANDGIHQLDLALMLMGDPGLPKQVSTIQERLAHKGDDSQMPDTGNTTLQFDDFLMTFEQTLYPKYMRKTDVSIRRNDVLPYWTQNATRIELYGTELMMTVGRMGSGWQVTTHGGKVVDQMYGRVPDAEHYANFLECVRTRKRPNADINIAEAAMNTVHMTMIAHRIGNQTVRFDPARGRFIDNPEANKLLQRNYRKGFELT